MTDKNNMSTETNKNEIAKQNEIKSGQIIQAALNNLNDEQRQELLGIAAKEALNLEVQHRHRVARHDSAKEGIADHIQAYGSLDKSGRTTRHTLTSDIETGSGKMKIESKSGATCFVATVAYGDINHPDVILLRTYRDNVLNNSSIGRVFIAWYWHNGPKLAAMIGWSQTLKSIAKFLIQGIVFFLRK